MIKMKKITCVVLFILLAAGLFAGCSAAGRDAVTNAASAEIAMDYGVSVGAPQISENASFMSDADVTGDTSSGAGVSGQVGNTAQLVADSQRKLIWWGSMQLETLEYDESEAALLALVEECGGYTESSQRYGGDVDLSSGVRGMRSGEFTVRVPAEKFDYFMGEGGSIATVISSYTGSEEVTDSYFDTEARLDVLLVKEERLLEMLEKGEDIQYLLEVENELANTRYEIELLTSTLRRYDGLIAYSTVEVTLREVRRATELSDPEPTDTWGRISARFTGSLKAIGDVAVEAFVFAVGYSPVFIGIAAVAVVLVIAVQIPVRRNRRRISEAMNSKSTENDKNEENSGK